MQLARPLRQLSARPKRAAGRPTRYFLSALFHVALAVAAFAACCHFIGGFTEPGSENYHELNVILRDKPPLDTLFLGSSQVNNQVDVNLFDQLNAESGCMTHSWNLGSPGEDILSVGDMFNQIINSASGRNLRTLVFEPYYVDVQTEFSIDPTKNVYETDINEYNIDKVTFHDFMRRYQLLTGPQRAPEPIDREKILLGLMAFLFIKLTHVGYIVNRYWRPPQEGCQFACVYSKDLQFLSSHGYVGYEGHTPNFNPTIYAQLRAWAQEYPAPPGDNFAPPEVLLQSIRNIVDLAAAHGVTAVLLGPPQGAYLPEIRGVLREYHRNYPNIPILSYADPLNHRELYEDDIRLDHDHLNTVGAERFTKELSADFRKITPSLCPKRPVPRPGQD